ncbi:hypothetical protein M2436_007201 [Streptomyces sp. HB372]|nr:hypothetical protein [Streptomyces sp. HB372]
MVRVEFGRTGTGLGMDGPAQLGVVAGDRDDGQERRRIGCGAGGREPGAAVGVIGGDAGAQQVVGGQEVSDGGPQTVLGEGGRHGDQRRLVEGAPVFRASAQPVHERGERGRGVPVEVGGSDVCGGVRGDHVREGARGGVLEDLPGAEREARRPCSADELDGGDAVAAEREEGVVAAGRRVQAQDVGEQVRQGGGGAGQRGVVVGGGDRGGQRRAVHLAGGAERQGRQYGQGRRDGVVGQGAGERRAQPVGVEVGPRPGDGVAGEQPVAGPVLAQHGGGLAYAGERGQGGLDLAQFDAEAAQFHLVVGAAQVLQLSVGAAAGQVAGAVHPGAGRAVGGGDEAGRGEAGAAQVAAGEPGSGDVQLAGGAGRYRSQRRVQDEGGGPGDGGADRDRAVVVGAQAVGVAPPERGVDGGLGGAVGVEHAGASGPGADEGGGAGLPGDDERGAGGDGVGGESGEDGGRDGEVGDAVLGEEVRERFAQPPVGGHDLQGGAGEQRHDNLPDRRVEAQRGELEDTVARPGVEGVGEGAGQGGQPGVGDGHALGPAGGPGGVDDVRGRVGPLGAPEARVVGGPGRRGAVDLQPGCAVGRGCSRGGEDEGGGRVGEHVRDPLRRVVRVDGEVDGSGLRDGEQGDDGLDGAGQHDRDPVLRPYAVLDEGVGQGVRGGVEPPVVQFGALAGGQVRSGEGGGVGVCGGDGGEESGQGGGGVAVRDADVLGAAEERGAFGGAEDLQPVQRCRGGGDGLGQEADQAVGERLCADGFEEVLCVLQDAFDAVGPVAFGEGEGQVELGGAAVRRDGRGGEPGEPDLARLPVLVRQHHLEERVSGQGAVRGERVDEVLERDVGVGVRGEVGLPDPVQEVAEGRVAGQVGAQDEVVDEEPDEVVQRGVVASGDGRADDDVPARPGAGEQGGERRVGDHEQRGGLGPGERAHRGVRPGRHGEPDEAAAMAGDRRTRPVGGQRQFGGQVAQSGPPVVELGAGDTVRVGRVVVPAECFALPQGEVGVLDGQRRPRGGVAPGAGGVGGGEVGEERARGPLVGGDVVDDEHDDVLVGGEPQQARAQRHVPLDVEGCGGRFLDVPLEFPLGAGGVGHREPRREVGRLDDVLARPAVRGREDGAQRLVTDHHVGDGGAQGGDVEGSGQPGGEGDVVVGPDVVELLEEPQPALRRGERQVGGAGPGPQRFGGPSGVLDAAGEGGDGRGLEDVAYRQGHVEGRPDPGGEAGREEGVAAEGEEVVVGSDLFAFQDLREEVGDDLFLRGRRGAPAGGGGGLGFGQGVAVELAVDGQRPVVDGDDGGRDEVVGQSFAQGLAEPVRGERAGGGGGVGEEPGAAAGGGAGEDDGVGDPVECGECGARLAGFDAEAPDLHLFVGAPEVVEFAVRRPAGEVPGAVHAGAGRSVRVGDEAGGGESVPAQVAPGQAGSGDVQLAGGPGGDGVQGGVEEPDG